MATYLSSVNQSSDFFNDYCCDACGGKTIQKIAEWYCETCLKCFCVQCNTHHNQLYSYHTTYGRGDIKKWPLSKKIEDFLQKCDVHKEKRLKMLCQDHDQLCCTSCAFVNHRQCTNVTIISDTIQNQNYSSDLKQLEEKIQTIVADLKNFESYRDASIQSVEDSYNDRLQEIRDTRERINAALNDLENNTLKELDDMRIAFQSSLKTDVEKCKKLNDELKQLSEVVKDLDDSNKAELVFIASKKSLSKMQESELFLKENTLVVEFLFSFQPNTDIEQYLSKQVGMGKIFKATKSLPLLADPNHVLTVLQTNEYDISIPSDSTQQTNKYITGICVIANTIIVSDFRLKRINLLDQHYKVISHQDMPLSEGGMCQISTIEFAVTLREVKKNGIQFFCINNDQLLKGKKLQLQHECAGIAHHAGNLFVTSRKALYLYNLSGELLKKIFEDTTSNNTVWKCAVSLTGDRIYVTNYQMHQLLTLATDGTLMSSFTDPELQNPYGVHVTTAGQVLVCGGSSIIQVDKEGQKKLASLVSKIDGMIKPVSVFYNSNTNSVILGQQHSKQTNTIHVIKVI